jgi:hypothetical protein
MTWRALSIRPYYWSKTAPAAIRPLLINSAGQYVTSILACLGVAEQSGGVG